MLILPLFLASIRLEAQSRIISGFVKDSVSGEILIGATVYCPETKTGCVTNNFGFYSLKLNGNSSYTIVASYIGFAQYIISLDSLIKKNDFLLQRDSNIDEVVIKYIQHRESARTSIAELTVDQIKSRPALFGEPDVLRALQSMPGISSGKEGTSGLFVRGGTPDQNLYLLDDVPLYYVNHIGGFVSTFDPDAIKSVKVYKGGFPARYEGRLSSIVDLRFKDGNMFETQQAFSLGLISAKYFIETPIKQDTSSMMFSARRCNIDLLTRAISLIDNDFDGMSGYTFYDLNFKYNRILNSKNRIFLSFYGGRDKLFINMWNSGSDEFSNYKYSFNQKERWGNVMGSLRLNHVYRSDLFSNITLSYSQFIYRNSGNMKYHDYSEGNDALTNDQYLFLQSGAADIILKKELTYFINEKHKADLGVAATLHVYNPGESRYSEDFLPSNDFNNNLIVPKFSLYVSDEYQLTHRITVDYGLVGVWLYTEDTHYEYLEPRISSAFFLNDFNIVTLSYAKMHQIVHLLSNSGTGLPTDVWIPSTNAIGPEESDQVAIGFESEFGNRKDWRFTIEGFYKKLGGLIELKEGVSLFSKAGTWQEKVEINGAGNIKGLEVFLEKKAGSTTGSVSYTLTRNERLFGNINNGYPYPYHYNKLHDISVYIQHNFSEKIKISASWFYNTGFPITLAQAKYNIDFSLVDGSIIPEEIHSYSGRNSSKMPDYHRLDLGVHFIKKVRKGTRTWSFSIYNVYNRQNAYYIFYDKKENADEIGLYQLSLFPIIPSFSYSLKF